MFCNKIENEKGQVLIVGLFAMLFVFLLITAIADLITVDMEIINNQMCNMQTTYIAEAGIEKAIYRLTQDSNYTGNFSDSFAEGNYLVSVQGTPEEKTITCTGTLGNWTHTLRAKAEVKGTVTPYTVTLLSYKE